MLMGRRDTDKLGERFLVAPGRKVALSDHDPADTAGWKQGDAFDKSLQRNLSRLEDLQYLMYAENRRALLIILQAMDAGGKDGLIRHVITAFNPQGCTVTSFKVPTEEEAEHDFLWRIHRAVPRRGDVGVFNRSQYEDVLVVRVHNLVPRNVWTRRFDMINDFEKHLTDNNVTILKFFLNISKEEQKKRLLARREDPRKRWKYSPGDLEERKHWADYMRAYEDVLSRCSTSGAPWFVIPSDRKWFRNLAVSQIIVDTLESLRMVPRPAAQPSP
jgi:PPK2 family polyphosphate:nucleotide phosphotransferase